VGHQLALAAEPQRQAAVAYLDGALGRGLRGHVGLDVAGDLRERHRRAGAGHRGGRRRGGESLAPLVLAADARGQGTAKARALERAFPELRC
jgi:hypothetical protein